MIAEGWSRVTFAHECSLEREVDCEDPVNNCPAILMSCLCQLIERVLKEAIRVCLQQTAALSGEQHGFM